MLEILKKELTKKDNILFFITIAFILIPVSIIIYNKVISVTLFSYSLMELMLIIFIVSFGTSLFTKYNSSMKKRLMLNDYSALKINITLVFFIFLVSLILVVIYWSFIYLFLALGFISSSKFQPQGGEIVFPHFRQINIAFFFYGIFMELIIMALYALLLNIIFYKNKTFIYAWLIIVCCFCVFLNPTFMAPLRIYEEGGSLTWNPRFDTTPFIAYSSFICLFLLPWTQIGILASLNFSYGIYEYNPTFRELFNTSNAEHLWFVNWMPFATIPVLLFGSYWIEYKNFFVN